MKRRTFLQVGALTLFGLASQGPFWGSGRPDGSPGFLTRMAHAATGRGRTLVVLFLRGGVDGLHAVPPYTDKRYYDARPRLAVPRPGRPGGALDLDGRFGLHPALAPLLPLYREKSLAIVHAVGIPVSSRSHFEAQDFLETGGGFSPSRQDGWLNRYLQRRADSGQLLRGLAALRIVPVTLHGKVPVSSLVSLEDIRATAGVDGGPAGRVLQTARDPNLQRIAAHTFQVSRALQRLNPQAYRPKAAYPDTALGEQLKLIAFLVKNDVGLEAVHAELDGWDTHAHQVASEGGMSPLMVDASRSLAAFWKDLGERRNDVTVVTLTEFGRRFKENGSAGTDHGRGTCCFVLGPQVSGGRIYGKWPGLQDHQLHEGMDLKVTTDYRDVLVSVAGAMGCPAPGKLFADYRSQGLPGLFRG